MEKTTVMNSKIIDPGKLRSFQRVTSADGYFLICALDHLSDFQELLDSDLSRVTYEQTGAAKNEIIRTLADECSAFLLDARYGLAQAIASRALPGTVGLMASVEEEDYKPATATRTTRFRENWGTKQMKMLGVDVCKLLWFFRPDSSVADHQREVVRRLAEECTALSLPLVVEPIWYPLEGEDPKSDAWRERRVAGIIESAREANALGTDMLKVEFPGYVDSEAGKAKALAACQELDGSVNVPWVILSAGVNYDSFKTQVEIACNAGASGFLAGRSIWRDAASTKDPELREKAGLDAANRLAELGNITRACGKPFNPQLEREELTQAFPEFWYEKWQRS
ncbi:MAG TPA: tagatose 1,6-diphosphate aldolase [Chthoniobacterales bacterium]|jgi:tagatose 1,6-diphosphate aldolase|nr:tagatose 1,6-diphosphate aldolase [Chthoniobacterales bacterium]